MTRHLARAFYLGHARRHASAALEHATDALVYLWLAARATDECVVVAPRPAAYGRWGGDVDAVPPFTAPHGEA